jgi:hypothetical protein
MAALVAAACLLLLAPAAFADGDPPVVAIAAPANGSAFAAMPLIEFSADDPDAEFTCHLDDDDDEPCVSPWTPPAASDGDHSVTVTATNALENSASDVVNFKIDSISPETQIDTHPDLEDVTDASATFTYSSDEPSVTFECSLDNGGWVSCPGSFNATLSDGTHNFRVRARDAAGNVDASPAGFPDEDDEWLIDTTGPVVTFGTLPDPTKRSSSASFTANEATNEFKCSVDGSSATPCASPLALTNLSDGPHTLSVTAKDVHGNVGAPATHNWTVTTQPPTVQITAPAGSALVNAQPSVNFNVSDPDGDVSAVTCRLDSGTPTACSTGWTAPAAADGDHTVTVTATDLAGHSASASVTYTLDTLPPNTTIVTHPDTSLVTQDSGSFSFSSDDPFASFQCSLDNGAWLACGATFVVTSLADGAHSLRVRARDAAGNLDPTPAEFPTGATTWLVDTTGPVVTIGGLPDPRTSSPTITFELNEAATQIRCRVDGGIWSPCDSPLKLFDLTEASHSIAVYATDVYGNVGAVSTHTWTVDFTPPGTPTLSAPADNTLTNHPTPTFSGTAEPFSLVRVYDGTTQLGGAQANGSGAWSYTPIVPLSEGIHSWRARAFDAALNPGGFSSTRTLRVDLTAPGAPAVSQPAQNAKIATRQPQITGTAEAGSTISVDEGAVRLCSTVAASGGAWGCTSSVVLPDGHHDLTVTARDAAGNESATTLRAFDLDATPPPAPQITAPLDGALTGSPAVTVSGTGTPLAAISISGGPAPIQTFADISGVWSHTFPVLADAVYAFSAHETDDFGNVSPASSTVTVRVDTHAPTASIAQRPSAISNLASPGFGFAADESPVSFECELDGAAWAACAANTVFGPLGEGVHTLRSRATDPTGNLGPASPPFSWTIDLTRPSAPQLNTPTDGAVVTIPRPVFSGTAENGASVEVVAGSASLGYTTANGGGAWTFTPAADIPQGVVDIRVRAYDAAGNSSLYSPITHLTVDSIAPSTSITTPPPAQTNNNTASIGFTSDDGTANFECKLDAGAYAACSSPRVLNGLADGPHTFAVRARDSHNNVDVSAAAVSWTVDRTAPIGQSHINLDSANSLGIPSFTIASNEPAAQSQCKVDNDAFSACSGTFRPTGLGEGPHALTVRYVDQAGNESTQVLAFVVTVPPNPYQEPPVTPPTTCYLFGSPAKGVGTVTISKIGGSARKLKFSIRTTSTAIARAEVQSGGKKIAGPDLALKKGTSAVTIKLKRRVAPGKTFTLSVAFANRNLEWGTAQLTLKSGKSFKKAPGAATKINGACLDWARTLEAKFK